MGGQTDQTPYPPPPPWPPDGTGSEGVFSTHQEIWRQQSLEQQLAATQDELAAMKQLIEELPEIFERRFALRLEPLLAHRERLYRETQRLRHDLLELQTQRAPLSLPVLPPQQQLQRPAQLRLTRALRHAFGLRRSVS
jgi:hypothetical protein